MHPVSTDGARAVMRRLLAARWQQVRGAGPALELVAREPRASPARATDLATARRIRLEVHEMPSAAARDVAARNSHESGVG